MKNPFRNFYLKRLSMLEEIKRLRNRVEELENQLETAQAAAACTEDSDNRQTIESDKGTDINELEKRLKLIQSLIKFRDQLLLFKDNAEDEGAAKLLTNLYRESGRILSINGVEVLNSGGGFSPDHHIVVETIVTEQQGLINTIESTFRDGYIVEGRLLRPQEVVVYVEKR